MDSAMQAFIPKSVLCSANAKVIISLLISSDQSDALGMTSCLAINAATAVSTPPEAVCLSFGD